MFTILFSLRLVSKQRARDQKKENEIEMANGEKNALTQEKTESILNRSRTRPFRPFGSAVRC